LPGTSLCLAPAGPRRRTRNAAQEYRKPSVLGQRIATKSSCLSSCCFRTGCIFLVNR